MRIVDPAELDPSTPLEPVLTASMPSAVAAGLAQAMRPVSQYDSAGPAKLALLCLDSGDTLGVVHHESRDQLEILAPLNNRIEQSLAEVLAVLRVPASAVDWVREGIARVIVRTADCGRPPVP